MDYTQEDIILGCIRKEKEYQRALYEEYASEMLAICLRYMDNKEDAEDVLQDTFIKIFSSPKHLESVIDLEKWLCRVFINSVINRLKIKKKLSLIEKSIEDYNIDNYVEDFVFDIDTKRFDIQTLLQALYSLRPEERIIFNMVEIEDMSYKEVEKLTGRNASTLRSLNMRAKIKMRNFLKAKEESDERVL